MKIIEKNNYQKKKMLNLYKSLLTHFLVIISVCIIMALSILCPTEDKLTTTLRHISVFTNAIAIFMGIRVIWIEIKAYKVNSSIIKQHSKS